MTEIQQISLTVSILGDFTRLMSMASRGQMLPDCPKIIKSQVAEEVLKAMNRTQSMMASESPMKVKYVMLLSKKVKESLNELPSKDYSFDDNELREWIRKNFKSISMSNMNQATLADMREILSNLRTIKDIIVLPHSGNPSDIGEQNQQLGS